MADEPVMSTQRLAEFLAAVSGFRDEAPAIRGAAERAAEAPEAEDLIRLPWVAGPRPLPDPAPAPQLARWSATQAPTRPG
jgi:hypothetical protein